jgi:hypothetical protein
MRFVQLMRAASVGLLQQIPIMGPVIQAILAEQAQATSEQKLADLIRELSQSRSPLEQSAPNLIPALLLAEAEVEQRLEKSANPQRRFLYLAADEYASLERTYEIAVRYAFLWRSYHNVNGAAISNVRNIGQGDLIALAYRVPGNRFRVLLPLIVTGSSPFTIGIDTKRFGSRSYRPFVWANSELSEVLRADYDPDPKFNEFTGLPVKPLYANVQSPEALGVLQGEFRSPGTNAIWRHDYSSDATEVPAPVRDWIARL